MAALSLREYVQKIENLIENNEVDQAVAHCKYILKMYPKHIDSYRLLGKAFLEKQKFGDASDIFQRVLSSIPDDFISHIGMSIIREDENNLDASIWHMERAFEVQPSNKAVQDELRRLYTKRDGVAPPKIRLTRGALVRMYVRGELYDQAIGEITTTLDEDPNRIDLEVILSKIYFLLGQKVEATEICSNVISKLPYCFEANKILTEILPGTTREEDQKIFRQRVIDLDPYFEFTSDEIQSTSDVPDSKIMIDYFEWDPFSDVNNQTDWTKSIGLSIENENSLEKDISFWLNSSENDESPDSKEEDEKVVKEVVDELVVEEQETEITQESGRNDEFLPVIEESFHDGTKLDDTHIAPSQEVQSERLEDVNNQEEIILSDESSTMPKIDATTINNELPDWIRDAGWEKSQETDSEIQKGFTIPPLPSEAEEKDPENQDSVDIEPGNIPDWIKEIAPKDEMENEKISDLDDEIGLQNLEDLISKFDSSDNANIIDETISSWESEFTHEVEHQELPIEGNLTESNHVQESEDSLAWLQNFTEKDFQLENNLSVGEPEGRVELEGTGEFLPEQSVEETSSDDENLDWLDSLIKNDDKKEPQKSDIEVISSQDIDDKGDVIPDWIKSVVDENEPPLESDLIRTSIPDEVEEESYVLETIEEEIEELEDEFTIVFDENDNIPESSEFVLEEGEFDLSKIKLDELVTKVEEEPGLTDINLDELVTSDEEKFEPSELNLDKLFESEELQQETFEIDMDEDLSREEENQDSSIFISSELVDEEEERIAEEALSQFEEAVDKANNELDPLREDFELSEFSEDKDETLSEVEEERENLESTVAWMAGITAFEASQKDLVDEKSELEEISSESQPEWLSKETSPSSEEEIDFDATPSWLKELEIEADSLSEQNLDQGVIKSIDEEIEIEDKIVAFEQLIPTSEIEEGEVPLERKEEIQSEVATDIGAIEETNFQIEDTVPDLPEAADDDVLEVEHEGFAEEFTGVLHEELTREVSEEVPERFTEELSEELHEELTTKVSEEGAEGSPVEFGDELTPIEESPEIENEVEEIVPLNIEPAASFSEKFEAAKHHLEFGEIDKSINLFDGLIKENVYLEDIISNIQSALDHHYPINIGLWKTLGDAYFKDYQLQKALDAYSKAEDLLS